MIFSIVTLRGWGQRTEWERNIGSFKLSEMLGGGQWVFSFLEMNKHINNNLQESHV